MKKIDENVLEVLTAVTAGAEEKEKHSTLNPATNRVG